MPTIYVIAGCNGAGKTTFAMDFLAREAKSRRFLNADEIARGLSPLDPASEALRAGRLLLEEFKSLVQKGESFAIESTLSGKTYVRLLNDAKLHGYEIELHYLWLPGAAQAIQRVKARVILGGHNIPDADVERRFTRSIENLITDYLPLATAWTIWDNRGLPPKQLAFSRHNAIDDVRQLLLKT
jgi:predicted ABC-type ATPase